MVRLEGGRQQVRHCGAGGAHDGGGQRLAPDAERGESRDALIDAHVQLGIEPLRSSSAAASASA